MAGRIRSQAQASAETPEDYFATMIWDD